MPRNREDSVLGVLWLVLSRQSLPSRQASGPATNCNTKVWWLTRAPCGKLSAARVSQKIRRRGREHQATTRSPAQQPHSFRALRSRRQGESNACFSLEEPREGMVSPKEMISLIVGCMILLLRELLARQRTHVRGHAHSPTIIIDSSWKNYQEGISSEQEASVGLLLTGKDLRGSRLLS